MHLESIIFELIKGEMAYVKDLENIEAVCEPSRWWGMIHTHVH